MARRTAPQKALSLDRLVGRLYGHTLSAEEKSFVLDQLAREDISDADVTKIIIIVGKSVAVEFRPLVEPFLEYPRWPSASEYALRTLVRYWGYAEDYAKEIKQFCEGVPWDCHDELKLCGIQMSRDLLEGRKDTELVRILLDIYDSIEDEKDPLKEAAFASIAVATGRSYKSLERNPDDWFEFVIDPQIVDDARKMA